MKQPRSPRVVAVAQARMGSERMPGKVMVEVAGKPLLAHLIERLRAVPWFHAIVVATSDHPREAPILDLAQRLGVATFAGSENDVLDRIYRAAREHQAEVVARITADEPLKDPEIISTVIGRHLHHEADYTSNVLRRTFPDGTTIEVCNFAALEAAAREAVDPADREHVTLFIWRQPDRFKLQNIEAEGPLRRPELRFCVDEPADFAVVRELLERLSQPGRLFGAAEIIQYLDAHPDLASRNVQVQERQVVVEGKLLHDGSRPGPLVESQP